MELPILSSLPALTFPNGETNAGGIVRVRLAPAHLLDLVPPERFPLPAQAGFPDNTVSAGHLIFREGASLSDITVHPAMASFSDAMEEGPNGESFRHQLQIILPKVRPDVVTWVQRYRAVRWVAFIQDRNGFCRMAGTPAQPLSISADSSQPMGLGNNQTVLTFTASVQQPAYNLTGVEDANLISAGPFGSEFGFMFDF